MKKQGKWIVLALALVLALSLGGCGIIRLVWEIQEKILEKQTGTPDQTGSWGQINQVIERPEGWKMIVGDSEFQLGAKKKVIFESTEDRYRDVKEPDYYEMTYGSYPKLDGSTVSVPMAIEFARQHLKMDDENASDMVWFNTTHGAYVHLIERWPVGGGYYPFEKIGYEAKPVDLIIVTEPSDEELALAAESGVELVVTPVCYDAFVFITHRDNPVDSLTVEQIRKIYTGEITNWSQVGGEDMPVTAYQREANSGSQTAMEKLVMQGRPMRPPEQVKVIVGMGSLIDAVAEYQNDTASIGYTYQYYIDTLYKNEQIKTLEIEGVSSRPENLKDGSYPFTTSYYGVILKGMEEETGGKFLRWMLSDEGQACIGQAGYVPLR
ncbi:MAG: PstS family phosphate ABC transporter substrate-binding protein [Christensenellales bacterium]